MRDFVPISLSTRAPYLLVVNAGNPVRTVRELVQVAKAQPDKLLFGAGNTGSGTHLVTAWFIAASGIQATYVPYRSVAIAMLDLAAGRLTATLANVLSVGPHVRSGRLHVLGISTAQRSKALPDFPTIAEQGVPGYNASTFHGYAAPAGTPAAIVIALSKALSATVRAPELADRISEDGGEPVGSTPAEFRQFIVDELRVWQKLVRDSGIRVE
jgi:tripartite-type tricarboxylate transporter receptor subunit TctC